MNWRRTNCGLRLIVPWAVRVVATILLFSPNAWAIVDAQGGTRHALVVGNADYKFAPQLANPSNDSRDICTSLKKLGYQATCAVDVKTRGAFKDLLGNFIQSVKRGDVILFYFAGHGIEMFLRSLRVLRETLFRFRPAARFTARGGP